MIRSVERTSRLIISLVYPKRDLDGDRSNSRQIRSYVRIARAPGSV